MLFTRKCLYPGMLHTGLLNKVKCSIYGSPIRDCIWLQLLMLLLWRYKNFNWERPSNTFIGGSDTIELSLRSIFFKFLKLWRNIRSLSWRKLPCKFVIVRFSHLASVFKHPVSYWFLREITLISDNVSHSVSFKSNCSVTNCSFPSLGPL
jgi:hypothetical protein